MMLHTEMSAGEISGNNLLLVRRKLLNLYVVYNCFNLRLKQEHLSMPCDSFFYSITSTTGDMSLAWGPLYKTNLRKNLG